jgi:ribose transport system permease protein
VIAVGALVVAWFLLKRTTFGMRIYAVGGNEQAAQLTGIRVWAVLVGVYAISGLCSAIAGIMMSARLFSANGLLGQGYELDAIAATILGGTSFTGGKGSVVGTLFGVLIIGVLNNGLMLTGVPYFWQLVAKGVVIISAVIIDIVRNKLNG